MTVVTNYNAICCLLSDNHQTWLYIKYYLDCCKIKKLIAYNSCRMNMTHMNI